MKSVGFGGCALSAFAATAMLSGCSSGSGAPLSPSAAGVTPDRTQARAYTLLYAFVGFGHDGAYPAAGVINVNGTLYGTTRVGGGHGCSFHQGCGTVYRIKASGKETVIYRFKGGPTDGQSPQASLLNVSGTLYGTTTIGGTYGNGTVFAITPSGRETVLYNFKGAPADGANPLAPLLNVNGTLYGTTVEGGAYVCSGSQYGCGTVFSIALSGKENVLYNFKGGTTDGENPYAGLINVKDALYSTTYAGGAHGLGTVFSITPSGKETVRYSFKGGTRATDGQNPQAGITHVNGAFYGTTTGGGAYQRGTVFAITPSGTETVLHSFGSGYDGAVPFPTRLIDVKGTLYGTTSKAGRCGNSYFPYDGCGTVFSITTSGKETVRHIFKDPMTGMNPTGLINVNGTLYGTTAGGGSYNKCVEGYPYKFRGCGIVFTLKP